MKQFITIIIFLLIYCNAGSQNLQLTAFAGLSNYQGDLQDKRYTFKQSHPAFGVGVLYDIKGNLSARANITFCKVSANDKYNSKNASRNLNFTSPVTDFHAGLEYGLFSLYEKSFTPYIFAGISFFTFNPYTNDTLGRKVFLEPLSTEGQGFYQNRKRYKLNQWAIPFGGGVKYALSDDIRIAFEIGLRKTNTDYLDDVSTNYVDEFILLTNRGQQAVDLAFRGDELKGGLTYPADGSQRGSAKSKDWYYFTGINLLVRLHGNGGSAGRKKSKTGCPTNIL
jgi:hypothetical protein